MAVCSATAVIEILSYRGVCRITDPGAPGRRSVGLSEYGLHLFESWPQTPEESKRYGAPNRTP